MFEIINFTNYNTFQIIIIFIIIFLVIHYAQKLLKRFLGIDIYMIYRDLKVYIKDLFKSLSINKDLIAFIQIFVAPIVIYYVQYFISNDILKGSNLNGISDVLELLINLFLVYVLIILSLIISPRLAISLSLFILIFIGRIYYNYQFSKVDIFAEGLIFLIASFCFYSMITSKLSKIKASYQSNP